MAVEIPSLIFMLREIFPHVHTWRFEKESDRQQIYSIIMQYFFEILQMSADQLKDDEKKTLLRNICVYSLLTNNGLSLLRCGELCSRTFMKCYNYFFLSIDS